jgi:hypothetical protein
VHVRTHVDWAQVHAFPNRVDMQACIVLEGVRVVYTCAHMWIGHMFMPVWVGFMCVHMWGSAHVHAGSGWCACAHT